MTIRHSTGAYEVLITSAREAMVDLPADAVIVTDRNVKALWGFAFPANTPVYELEPGEGSKTFQEFEKLLSWLADNGTSRKTILAAVGGGVVGDLAGFAAATYMRGLPLIQVPTTLLAQVDASVGGKVAIDMPQGKNLVGSFYQPIRVAIPVDTLSTLEGRQFNNGMAEVVKYGFIMDAPLLDLLQARVTATSPGLSTLIERCVALKAQVVEEDETELTGRRAILNFGHTIGHAIEKVTGYGPILHGEAISIGMVVETRLGERLSVTSPGTAAIVERFLEIQGLPTTHETLGRTADIMQAIALDKKASRGSLAFSLITKPGECKLMQDVPPEAVEAALKEC